MDGKQFAALLSEDRRFPPPPDFAARANVADESLYEQAARDREGFWAAPGGAAALVPAVGQGAGVEPAVRAVVRRAAS